MTRTADDILVHHGVKGMKWGVRRAEKKAAKADKKWEKSIYSTKGAVAVHNETAKRVNARLDVLNSKPEFATSRPLDQPDGHPTKKAYIDEYLSLVNKSYGEAVTAVHGTSPSGKKKAVYVNDDLGERIEVKDATIQHAEDNEPDLTIQLKRGDNGLFVFTNFAELQHADVAGDFLAHHGIKGMKWGVRRDHSPAAVDVKTAPGRKVKTSGGQHHSPHEDAIKAAKIRQQAKKSTTDSLSNKELQDLITRMNLENQYANMNKNNVSAGKKLLRVILGQTGDKEVSQLQEFANTKRGTQNDPMTNFAVKVAVSGAKTATGANGNGKKK